jgi:hypothetical protein
MSKARFHGVPLVLTLSLVGLACANEPEPTAPVAKPAEPASAEPASAEPASAEPASAEPASADPEPTRGNSRLDAGKLDALGEPQDSPCRAHAVEAGLERGGCKIVGPYPGVIEGTKGTESEAYAAALDACVAADDCIGVSSDWYTGSAWYPVLGATSFAVDTNSYGCTLILDCR